MKLRAQDLKHISLRPTRSKADRAMSRRAFVAAAFSASAGAAYAGFRRKPRGVGSAPAPPPSGGFDFVIGSRRELDVILAGARATPAAFSGLTVGVLDGDYGSNQVDATGIRCTSQLLFFAVNRREPLWPGFATDGSTHLTFQRIRAFRARNVVGTAADITAAVCRVAWGLTAVSGFSSGGDSDYISILDCEISSNPMATMDFGTYAGIVPGSGNGLAFQDGELLSTSGGVSFADGNHFANLPQSTSTRMGIVYTGASNASTTIATKWNGATVTGQLSGATRVLTSPANVSNATMLHGVYTQNAFVSAHHLVVEDCDIHDVDWPLSCSGLGISYQRNTLVDCYTSFGNLTGFYGGSIVKDNRGSHVWALHNDGAFATSGPHSSLFGFSQAYRDVSDVVFEGNVFCIGYNRFLLAGVSGRATGPKQNDQAQECKGSLSGNILTITSGNLNTNNQPIKPGMRIRAPGLPEGLTVIATHAEDATLTGTGTGTTGSSGMNGTYRISSSAYTIPAGTTFKITSRCINWKIRSNLLVCNDAIGWEFAFADSCEMSYNSIFADRTDPAGNASTGLDLHDCYPNCVVSKNVSNGCIISDVSSNSADLYANSFDNRTASFAFASGPAAYEQMYVGRGVGGGNDFLRIDHTNALVAFAAKTGGPLDGAGIGHDAFYNFSTRTSSYPATPTPPTSTVPTSLGTSHVNFNGTVYSRWTGATGEALMDAGDPSKLTIVVQAKAAADGVTYTLVGAKHSAFVLTRQGTDNKLRLIVTDPAAATSVTLDTSAQLLAADGLCTLVFSLDFANYKARFAKNGVNDPFLSISTWTGQPFRTVDSPDTITIGANYSAGQKFAGVIGAVLINDSFIDTLTAAGLSKVFAQDGGLANPGSTGATMFGSASRVAMNDNAAAWNDVAGVNHGTTGKFKMGAGMSLSDAA
jgi:hypothetical protein